MKNIYVVCPAFLKTGGTELAHQLVYELNKNGLDARIAYHNSSNRTLQITESFCQYVSTFVDVNHIVDSPDNLIVCPESHPEIMADLKKSM